MTVAEVRLWNRLVGAVLLPDDDDVASFEYDPEWLRSGLEVSPLLLPARAGVFRFPALSRDTFRGLPGLLADALPDKFGNALIDQWLAAQGRPPRSLNSVERLCYIGRRGMGALEFEPAAAGALDHSRAIDVAALVELASDILAHRHGLDAHLSAGSEHAALEDILSVGTSAGGARAKAVIAWNPNTGEIRSGQLDAGEGFEQWLLKFDGVSENRDRERLADPQGFGRIEFAYWLMARAAGIDMTESRLLEEGGRAHFMTRRFDRDRDGRKLHMQSLCGLAHYDFNLAGAYSYEQALQVIRHGLGLPVGAAEEQFRRMVFNVVARNQDDHTKNIAFLMGSDGRWQLSPAFDMTFAYGRAWTATHQMTINAKRDGLLLEDLRAVASVASMKPTRVGAIVAEVRDAVGRWPEFADAAGVSEERAAEIGAVHRLALA